jgi:Phosphofructokinase
MVLLPIQETRWASTYNALGERGLMTSAIAERICIESRTVRQSHLDRAMRIALSTGGGDAPGLNAVIRAAVLSAVGRGWDVLGIKRGYAGLLGEDEVIPLTRASVRGIAHLGGTILRTTNRGNPFNICGGARTAASRRSTAPTSCSRGRASSASTPSSRSAATARSRSRNGFTSAE